MKRRDFIKLGGFSLVSAATLRNVNAETANDSANFVETIIIGTGYGASVAALRLAQNGFKSVMIEMGKDWRGEKEPFSKLIPPKKESTWLKKRTIAPFGNLFGIDKYTGVLDRVDFDNMRIYAGRAVGGGSIVNGGMAVVPKRSYFETIFPNLDSSKFYDYYFPLAQKSLKVNEIDPAFFRETPYYRFARVGIEQAHKAGYKTVFVPNVYDFEYMKREAKGETKKSALDGEVIYGNNHGKKSLDKTYLKAAAETGLVSILPLHKVEEISRREPYFELKISRLNERGEVVENKILRCKNLFVCAGSLGTSQLLVKAKAEKTLPLLSENVGRNWGNNGNTMCGRNFIRGGTGIKQSTIPVAGVDNWEDAENPFFAEISPLPMNLETWTTLYLVITKLKQKGNLYYDKTTGAVNLNWTKNHSQYSIEIVEKFLKKMDRANGGTRARMLFNRGIGEKICYHPLGGCAIGEATDEYGRIKGYPNLYTTDGSLIPGSIGVNPFLTITAIAEFCIENIIRRDFKKA